MHKLLLVISLLFVFNVSANGQASIKLMTYNILYDSPNDGENHWELRKRWMSNQIKFVEPEVFGIQEGLFHQVSFLDDALPDYGYVGVGRDDC